MFLTFYLFGTSSKPNSIFSGDRKASEIPFNNVENINLKDCYGDGGANHAIGVMSCARDAMTGNLTHFYINDTGRDLARDACRKINVVDFLRALNVKRGIAIISKKPIW